MLFVDQPKARRYRTGQTVYYNGARYEISNGTQSTNGNFYDLRGASGVVSGVAEQLIKRPIYQQGDLVDWVRNGQLISSSLTVTDVGVDGFGDFIYPLEGLANEVREKELKFAQSEASLG